MNALALEPALPRQMALLLPYLVVAGGGLLVMLAESFRRTMHRGPVIGLSVAVLAGAILAQLVPIHATDSATLLGGMISHRPYTAFFNTLFLAIALVTAVFATIQSGREGGTRGDVYPLLLFSVLGMMVLAAANDLLALYLGLETMSLAVYVLVGGRKSSIRSSEAGFKYLLLGGFASAFLLFGMALVFGFAGTTSLDAIRDAMAARGADSWLLALGGGLMLVGFGFKIAMVPFHMWTPDVYDGAPSFVTGFMATGVKAAAFAALLRVSIMLLPALSAVWFPLLVVLAVLTMTFANLVALAQTNIKRMLAYSSVAHAGYLLLGVLAVFASGRGARTGADAAEVATAAGGGMLFYLVGYTLTNLAAFGVVGFLAARRTGAAAGDASAGDASMGDADEIQGYAGLARRQPLVAAALAVSLFSLAGIPPTVGFMAKFYVFEAVVRAGLVPLAVWGVVNSLLGVYYYLRVVVLMYMSPGEEHAYDGRSAGATLAVSLLALLTLALGVLPGGIHRLAEAAFRTISF
jgi:NADH-quinone oxidoreductase subunit N